MSSTQIVAPRYGAGCFSDLPQTIKHLLTGEGEPALPVEFFGNLPRRYGKVVLFFADAFGWQFFERHRDSAPFLRYFCEKGAVARITAQFPSTTAAHVTCIHTGLTPAQSGVFEWQYYEPRVDQIIAPLLYSPAGTKECDALKGVEPGEILPTRTLYQDLQKLGVKCWAFQPGEHLKSSYTRLTYQGAEVVPYRTLAEGLVNLRLCLARAAPPAYFFFYFDGIDVVGHEYGPQAPQVEAEIDAFLTIAERLFLRQVEGRFDEALLMVIADHGLAGVDPATTLYLNLYPDLEGIERFLRRNRKGELLVPAGSCRDLFLYVEEGKVEEAHAFLGARLEGRAEVCRVHELAERGFFGPLPVSQAFRERAGDLVILPHGGESVWWYEKDRFEQKFRGAHGGLSAEEMEVPLLLGALGG